MQSYTAPPTLIPVTGMNGERTLLNLNTVRSIVTHDRPLVETKAKETDQDDVKTAVAMLEVMDRIGIDCFSVVTMIDGQQDFIREDMTRVGFLWHEAIRQLQHAGAFSSNGNHGGNIASNSNSNSNSKAEVN